jgi:phage terminase small subunit
MEAKTRLPPSRPDRPAEPIDKTRRIPEKTRRAIELLATGKCKTQTEAAAAVGTTRETLCRNLAKPHILEFMRQRAMRTIAMAAGRAAEVKAELLDCADNTVRDRSSTFVLGVAGIAPRHHPRPRREYRNQSWVRDRFDRRPAPRRRRRDADHLAHRLLTASHRRGPRLG